MTYIFLTSCSNNNGGTQVIVAETTAICKFISVGPSDQTTDFIIHQTHTFQKIIEAGDLLTDGGTLPQRNDFTGYVPINKSSANGVPKR
ncbi:hypothetical protein [Maribacter sp. ACAM166]|uniref:hypothetical protein n=1 Tax=Maribacter sp. ACAM166 TaxID=2508996 RepID=UPI0014850C29|nr:hypothetical protein [Maribacter sp. ACAM166]